MPMPGAEAPLMAILARYVVLTRQSTACRNIDLLASATGDGPPAPRGEVGIGWRRPASTSTPPEMAEMAAAVVAHLATRPEVDLYDTISAHDLH